MLTDRMVLIPADGSELEGVLAIPPRAHAVVLFAHGTGSTRRSSRNAFVATALRKAGIGTLLFDLLTEEEEAGGRARFDIQLLTHRLLAASAWLARETSATGLARGYFGASTGAAAALAAAAAQPEIRAVVSRGGRPDLAADALPRVRAATLLIVGALDTEVLALNRGAFSSLKAEKDLAIVPGATHLFEEPGALERVADLAADWFVQHLVSETPRGAVR